MAKMKLKLDWKGLLVAHGEKIVAGLLAIAILMVIWSGIGREQLSVAHTPDEISKKADRAKESISRTTWVGFKQRPELKDYSNRSMMERVELDPYTTTRAYDNPVFQHKVRRADPVLLSVGEIEVHAGFGAFATVDQDVIDKRLEDEGNSAKSDFMVPRAQTESGAGLREHRSRVGYTANDTDIIKGIRYAIVTGLVPVAEQQDKYNAVFQPAIGYDPQNDVPTYLGYVVERRDLAEDGTGSDWSVKMVFQPSTVRQQAIAWSGVMLDVVQEKYTAERLTYPLGPLVLKNWGPEVAHRKVSLGGKQVQQDEPQIRPKRPDPRELLNDDFGRRTKPKAGPKEDKKPQEVADVKLLRYFDFAVEPGKQYQYRFRLVLRDPNTIRDKSDVTPQAPPVGTVAPPLPTVPVAMLKQEVIDRINDPKTKKNMRFTDWSDPSPVVSIPYDNRLLAGKVELPARSGGEPLATIMVKAFDIDQGTEIVGEEKFARGSVVRFEQDVTIVNPKTGKTETIEKYVFDPQAIVLDIRFASPRRGRTLVEPAEVLIQDQTGRLVVRSELADELDIAEARERIAKPQEESKPANAQIGAPAPGGKDPGIDAEGLLDNGTNKKRKDKDR